MRQNYLAQKHDFCRKKVVIKSAIIPQTLANFKSF